jgi:hypothetical protein
MRDTACDTVCRLIDREASGWSEAERLRVEQHLGECEECSEVLSVSRFVRDTLNEAAGQLPEATRSRAIRNALSESTKKKPRLQEEKTWPRWTLGLTLSAAAAAVALWVVRTPAPTELATSSAPRTEQSASQAAQAPSKLVPGDESAPIVVESKGRESHTFAHATVTFSEATRTRFDAAQHTLFLEQGAIDVDVDPSKGEPFVVVTRHFRVEVLGTRFSVTNDTVRVEHGRVRVVGPDEAVLASTLGAGEAFTLAPNAAEKPRAVGARGSAREHNDDKTKAKPSGVSASALLAEARRVLGQGDKAGARALIQRAESAHPSRADQAEAGTLRAEIFLLERDSKSALRAYRELASKYGELSAGENAAFAALQLAAKVDPEKARGLIDAYLTRYPRGRFVDEARERLRRLDAR